MSWLMLAGMTLITFANRFAFFTTRMSWQPGNNLRKFLAYSSYAILTSIWTPILFSFDSESGFDHAGLDYLVGASIAALLSFLRLPSLAVVVISTSSFFVLRAAL